MILEELADAFRNRSAAIWFGAGVSIPSGIPGAEKLSKALLQKANLTKAQQERIAEIVPRKLPFERLMEVVLDSMDETAQVGFLRLFQSGQPCGYHKMMALLAKKRYLQTAYTTNFDTHLETALASEDVSFHVYDDPDALASASWSRNTTRVVKLHGSCQDPSRMAVTVRRIAGHGAGQHLRDAVEHVFRGPYSHVLVLGYSFSDRFDISPLIREFGDGSATRVIVVEHTGRSEAKFETVERLADDGAHPLRNYENAVRIHCSTAQFVGKLASRLALGPLGSCSQTPESGKWRRLLDTYFESLRTKNGHVVRPHLSGSFLRMISADEEALPHFRRVLKIARKTDDARRALIALQDLGGALIRTNRVDEALPVLREAHDTAKQVEGGAFTDHALSQLGNAYKDLGDACYMAARSYFDGAINVARASGDKRRCSPHFAGLASTWLKLGDFDAAQAAYQHALDAIMDSGDLYRKAEIFGNIGSMAYIIRDYAAATEWYTRAIELSKLTGDSERVGIHIMNLANVLVKQGKLTEALNSYSDARSVLIEVLGEEHPALALVNNHKAQVERMLAEQREQAGDSELSSA